jgi:hypothetical protein
VVRSPKSGKIAICVATATPNPASTLAIDSTRDIVRDWLMRRLAHCLKDRALAREPLPALDNHVAIARVDLHREAHATGAFGGG